MANGRLRRRVSGGAAGRAAAFGFRILASVIGVVNHLAQPPLRHGHVERVKERAANPERNGDYYIS